MIALRLPASCSRTWCRTFAYAACLASVLALAPWTPAAAQNGLSSSVAADFEVRLTRLESTLRELNGKYEESTYAVHQMRDRLEKLASDLDYRFQQLESGAGGGGSAAPARSAGGGGKNSSKAPQVPASVPAATGDTAAPTEPPPARNGKSGADEGGGSQQQLGTLSSGGDAAQNEYERAFAYLRDADYEKAEKALADFLRKHGGHALAGNAQYWLGETYYVRGKFKESTAAFAEGYQKYPKNAKAADSLLKLAMSLGQLGQKKDACLALGQLRQQFPNAAVTIKRRAEQEGKKHNCS